ncbi:TetR-like C-terminal domain-containing protein [Paenibacillus solisilvae]|uniref:TetR-like C-terminal domain-containing protein n=1 Tax=Paenibacillus solisilvae TaxID=2486751 RepID=A0ABW0VW63_9BACL
MPDTGSALADLQILFENMLTSIGIHFGMPSPSLHKMFAGMLDSQALIMQYKENFLAPRRAANAEILRRGIQSGEIHEDVNMEILIDLISGAYFYCLLFKPNTITSGAWLQEVFQLLDKDVSKP